MLESVDERGSAEIATAIEMPLNRRQSTLQDPDAVADAVGRFRRRPALGYSGCLVLATASKAGHLPLGTFDTRLAKLPGRRKV